jgi:hypothetical protein
VKADNIWHWPTAGNCSASCRTSTYRKQLGQGGISATIGRCECSQTPDFQVNIFVSVIAHAQQR